ncbi:truncated hemoglobin YjbI [Mesorhizobium soli]|uniref:hypothetical protein n=1 Tax=Pseudaminobacter soli (ex Li et al. 2025) TaxID=1295366 RepID=UPI00247460B1|nr:hypothetical protein [Mesorhizobium soli]MDH6234002.1 truncated hemoglobin YjbI [Mesorhizobium soli]
MTERPLAQPQMDRAVIGRRVRTFYVRIRSDPRLGAIFAREIAGDWELHLGRWSSLGAR